MSDQSSGSLAATPDAKDVIWTRTTLGPDLVLACRWCGRPEGDTPQSCQDPVGHERFHTASEETSRRPLGFYGPARNFSARKSVAA